MKKAELLKITEAVAEEYFYDYEYIGVRTQEAAFKLGETDHVSSVWVDGEETSEELDGICCTKLDSPAIVAHCDEGMSSQYGTYYGCHIAIIAGNEASYGEDEGELIIRDATVIKIIC